MKWIQAACENGQTQQTLQVFVFEMYCHADVMITTGDVLNEDFGKDLNLTAADICRFLAKLYL